MDKLDSLIDETSVEIANISKSVDNITGKSNRLIAKVSEASKLTHSVETHQLLVSCTNHILNCMDSVAKTNLNEKSNETSKFNDFVKSVEEHSNKLDAECQLLSTVNEFLRNKEF